MPTPARSVSGARTHIGVHRVIGRTPYMLNLFGVVERFAPHTRVALVSGETGTGKRFLARMLHRLGPVSSGDFVEVSCGTFTEGAPWAGRLNTGAAPDRDAATLFVDDVDESPKQQQAQLLGLLRAGDAASSCEPPAVVVVAATTRDIREEVRQGRFRADLFYRLAVLELHLPPLRERLEDVDELSTTFIQEISVRLGRPAPGVTAGALRTLRKLPWPGNLRELRNVLERACVLSDGTAVGEGAVRAALMAPSLSPAVEPSCLGDLPTDGSEDRLVHIQRAHVRAILSRARGNKSIAARHLGVSRRSLYRLLDRLGA